MKKHNLAILILSTLVIVEGIFIIRLMAPKPERKISKIRPQAVKGVIAIVLDDWGYNLNNLFLLRQIRSRLTVSVLPSLGYSKRIAQEAHSLGFEVILHLPMEPEEKIRLEQNTIMTSMDDKAIKNILLYDLNNVFYAKGLNNHMGSKATKNSQTMSVIFDELKKRELYFLDSYVTSESVCFGLARKKNIGFAKRDIFLDNTENPEYIIGQINKLKMKAKVCGQAIGIGHARRVTLEVLRDVMPLLEKEGYKFVFVSDLAR